MELKKIETIFVCDRNAYKKKRWYIPIKLRLGYEIHEGEYVLCLQRLFYAHTHFTLEEVEDMRRILIKANKNIKENK